MDQTEEESVILKIELLFEEHKEKVLRKNKQSLRDLRDIIRSSNMKAARSKLSQKKVLNKNISRFFIRNFERQKTMSQCIQSPKRGVEVGETQPKIPYPVKLSFRSKGDIKTFADEQKS